LSKDVFASIERIMWFLPLLLFICCITFIHLYMLNHHYMPGMKPTWSWCMIFVLCYWIWFVNILLRMLCIYLL
jgi:hypothetical protein